MERKCENAGEGLVSAMTLFDMVHYLIDRCC
jgi:hypothetical protein